MSSTSTRTPPVAQSGVFSPPAPPPTGERSSPLPPHATSTSILAVRAGHGANCSSIGSVIDTLFAAAVVGGALFAAVLAALSNEKVTVVGEDNPPTPPEEPAP